MFKSLKLKFKAFIIIYKALKKTIKDGKDINPDVTKTDHIINMKSSLSKLYSESNNKSKQRILQIRLERDQTIELLRVGTLDQLREIG